MRYVAHVDTPLTRFVAICCSAVAWSHVGRPLPRHFWPTCAVDECYSHVARSTVAQLLRRLWLIARCLVIGCPRVSESPWAPFGLSLGVSWAARGFFEPTWGLLGASSVFLGASYRGPLGHLGRCETKGNKSARNAAGRRAQDDNGATGPEPILVHADMVGGSPRSLTRE